MNNFNANTLKRKERKVDQKGTLIVTLVLGSVRPKKLFAVRNGTFRAVVLLNYSTRYKGNAPKKRTMIEA